MKSKNNPLVSIIIPVYNGSDYMEEAIDSAISQDYPNIEILVINDGSTDGGKTEKIAKSYGDKIRYYKKANGGVSTALNYAISKMKGDYFSWLSHDDRYYSNKISTQIKYINDHNLQNEKVILYSNYDVINENGKKINQTNFEVYEPNKKPEYACVRGLVSGISLLIPAKAFKEVGLFDERYRCIQDYLLFSLMGKTYEYIFLNDCTTSTRVHSNQVTNKNPNIIKENDFLWVEMQKHIPDDKKIILEGSLYLFFKEMYNFLITHNNYKKAQEYTKAQMQKYYLLEKKAVENFVNKNASEDIIKMFDQKYNSKLEKFYSELGYFETLKIIAKITKGKLHKVVLNKIKDNINSSTKLNYDEKIFKKLIFCLKKDGLIKTIKKGAKYLIRLAKKVK